MVICPACGVELADTVKICPLCKVVLPVVDSGDAGMNEEIFQSLSTADKKKVFIEVYSVCSLIGCFVVLAVELIINRRIWWSLYPIFSIVFLYSLCCVPLLLSKIPVLYSALICLSVVLYMYSIAFVSGGLFWFWPVALPIILVTEVSVLVCVVLSLRSDRQGLNVIALALLGVSFMCMGIETVLNLYTGKRFILSWSAVVSTAAVAIAVFLFYVHYRLNNRSSLKKLFHV